MMKIITRLFIFILILAMPACSKPLDEPIVTEQIENIVVLPSVDNLAINIEETEAPTEIYTEAPTEPVEITFSYEYVTKDDVMPYALFTPSIADSENKLPLIVWLHGAGELCVGNETFFNSGLPAALSKWELEGFGAYVICPHIAGNWGWCGRWATEQSLECLKNVIDSFVSEYNVDTDNITIMGHSLGGYGAMYAARHLDGYFSKLVVMSGFEMPLDELKAINIPAIGFSEFGRGCHIYMESVFCNAFGQDSTHFFNVSHDQVPMVALTEDLNGDNYSDLIAWILDKE